MRAARTRRADRGRTEPALKRAALLRVLAAAFAYPEAGHARRVGRLFALLPRTREEPPALELALARAARAWEGATEGLLRDEYARLFLGHAACTPRETAYGDGRRIGGRTAELADISGFYAAFGFALSDEDRQPPDHLCAELEFCSLLAIKAAYGMRRGRTEGGRIAEAALRSFLRDHLGRWVRAFCAEMERAGARSPYRELALLLEAALQAEMKRLRVQPAPLPGPAAADFMQADAFACPREAEAQAQAA